MPLPALLPRQRKAVIQPKQGRPCFYRNINTKNFHIKWLSMQMLNFKQLNILHGWNTICEKNSCLSFQETGSTLFLLNYGHTLPWHPNTNFFLRIPWGVQMRMLGWFVFKLATGNYIQDIYMYCTHTPTDKWKHHTTLHITSHKSSVSTTE